MELLGFAASCEALERFYGECSDTEKVYLDEGAMVANSKVSYTSKLFALGEGVEKVLQQRKRSNPS